MTRGSCVSPGIHSPSREGCWLGTWSRLWVDWQSSLRAILIRVARWPYISRTARRTPSISINPHCIFEGTAMTLPPLRRQVLNSEKSFSPWLTNPRETVKLVFLLPQKYTFLAAFLYYNHRITMKWPFCFVNHWKSVENVSWNDHRMLAFFAIFSNNRL